MRIPFGPWRPDQAALGLQGLVDVRNAIPAQGQWLPQRGLVPSASQTITAPVQGLWTSHRLTGDLELFVAFGGRIYLVPSRTGDLIDVTSDEITYEYATGEDVRWRGIQFGDLHLITNFVDEVQARDLIEGGDYDPLSEDAPRAKYMAQVRDFPVLGYTYDSLDGEDAYRLQWPGFTNGLVDPTNWTTGQADFQRLSDIGQINGLTGGEFGTIVCEQGIAVMQYGGALFSFDVRERRLGCRVPNTVNQYRGQTVFWSPEGWVAFDGGAARPIGVEKLDRWFSDDLDESYGHMTWATVETGRGHMVWAYCGRGHGGRPNRLLRYAPSLDEWAVADIEMDALASGKTYGYTLDDDLFDDLEAFEGDLEDPSLWASLPQTVAVRDSAVQSFAGAPLTATFTIGEFQLGGEETRAIARRALVLAKGGTQRLMLAASQRHDQELTWGSWMAPQSDGWFRFRVPGRSHSARVSLSGAWGRAQGLDVFAEELGTH